MTPLSRLLTRTLMLDLETTRSGRIRHIGTISNGQVFEKGPSPLLTSSVMLSQVAARQWVVSDGSVSPDNMALGLKRASDVVILERFSDLVTPDEKKDGLWDETYFVETIG